MFCNCQLWRFRSQLGLSDWRTGSSLTLICYVTLIKNPRMSVMIWSSSEYATTCDLVSEFLQILAFLYTSAWQEILMWAGIKRWRKCFEGNLKFFFFFWSDVLEHITNRKEDLFFYLFPGISNALHSHLCVLIYFVFLLLTPTTCLWLVELRLAWVAYILLLNHAVSSVREPFICFGISSSSFSFTPKCKWFLLVIPCYLGLDKMLCLQGLWSCN